MKTTCSSCNREFEIYQEDQAFLQKIGGLSTSKIEIPLPKNCPQCRQMRRMAFRNQRKLYKRKCDLTGKNIISVFSPESKFKVYDKDVWYSEKFDATEYARDFDFQKSFFEQFAELMAVTPMPSLRIERSENCDFNNDVSDSKNCYMCARTHKSSDMLYTYRGNASTSCTDCYQAINSELLYECTECLRCYNCRYLNFCTGCTDCAFLYDCHNCKDCLMSTNLRNKQYYFQNEQLSKEEYEKRVKTFDWGSHKATVSALKILEMGIENSIKRNLSIISSENCTGDNIVNSKNCFQSFGVKLSRDGRYLWDVKEYIDSMDIYSGGRNSELTYEATSTTASYNCKFCVRVTYSREVMYSMYCHNCKNVFGCIGLTGKQFCILNKQYSEAEYFEKLASIIDKMIKENEFGEFFPGRLSHFGYNETIADSSFPLSKTEALKRGYNWTDYEAKTSDFDRVIEAKDLPDKIEEVDEKYLEHAIKCAKSGKLFKIVPTELQFYKRLNIPLPHLSPDERFNRRSALLNPPKLRQEKCASCGTDIKTTYPEGTKNIYCEKCYSELFF